MVSEWRSVIAVSLNVGGGVRLIKPAKLCMCRQNTNNTKRTDARRRCLREWFRTTEPLGKCHYENWNAHTHTGRTHGAGCVRQWFRTTEPLGERRYENWNTHTHIVFNIPQPHIAATAGNGFFLSVLLRK